MKKAAFVFIIPGADPKEHKSWVSTPNLDLLAIGISRYDQIEKLAEDLINQGITAIELCAGFGHEGVSIFNRAVAGRAALGVVRFACHPGLNGQSGDGVF